jgi:fucose 4-O-acetylase-like acetyltransferase
MRKTGNKPNLQTFIQQISTFLKNAFSVRERNLAWINLARGIVIIMVVYRHSFEGIRNSGINISSYHYLEVLNNMMYTFRMPLFFVISGILMNLSFKKSGLRDYLIKRAQFILYPYLVWSFIQVSLQLLFPHFVNAKTSFSSYLDILFDPREIQQFWYLHTLFFIMVIYSIMKFRFRISPIIQFLAGILFFYLALYLQKKSIHLYFLNDILGHYLFFATGDLLSSFLLNKNNRDKMASPKLFFASLPVFILLHIYYMLGNNVAEKPIILLIIFSGIVFSLSVSFMFEQNEALQWLKVLGANSLYIYLMHVMVMAASRVMLIRLFHIDSVLFILFFNIFLGLVVPILLYNLFNRMGFWWLFTPTKQGRPKDPKPLVAE